MENFNLRNRERRIVNRSLLLTFRRKLGIFLYTVICTFILISFSTSAGIKRYSPKSETLVQDSAKITVRRPLESKMIVLKKSKDYQYGVQASQVLDTWWQRLLNQLFHWFANLFTGADNPTFWKTVAYVFIASVVVLVTLKLMGVDFSGLYRKKNSNEMPFETLGENIHAIDFTEAITQAITQKNYRLAIRLYYLKTLKELTDHEMIDWQINKTNRSYVYELNSPTLRPDFERITRQFEYAWYGDFPVDEPQFIHIKNQFLKFSSAIYTNGQ